MDECSIVASCRCLRSHWCFDFQDDSGQLFCQAFYKPQFSALMVHFQKTQRLSFLRTFYLTKFFGEERATQTYDDLSNRTFLPKEFDHMCDVLERFLFHHAQSIWHQKKTMQ